MENEYILVINIESETKKMYENALEEKGFQIVEHNESQILLAKKTIQNTEIEEKILKLAISIAKLYTGRQLIYVDMSKDINEIIKKEQENQENSKPGIYARWKIGQAIKKAIRKK